MINTARTYGSAGGMTEVKRDQAATLPAGAWNGRATIPFVKGIPDRAGEKQDTGIPYDCGDAVAHFTLRRKLCRGRKSLIFIAEDRRQRMVAVKLYEPGAAANTPALSRLSFVLQRGGCPALMPLLAYGDLEGGIHYEVMPVYQEGTLEHAVVTEEELRATVLPQLNAALTVLGKNHLVHNDIKPANLFWRDRGRKQIVLGDYDCLSLDKDAPAGGTLLFMAPERIYSDGTVHTPASDYCSLGLTLLTLLTGKLPFAEEAGEAAGNREHLSAFLKRRWQRRVACPENLPLSPNTFMLLDGLLRQEARDRYGSEYIRSWLENGGRGVRTYKPQKEKKTIRGLRYRQKLILDIPELIHALGNDWAYGTFMLEQHRLDDFVRQFNGAYYSVSQRYAGIYDHSEGLFRLMQTIAPSEDFYWLGEHYASLAAFADATEQKGLYGANDPFCLFCRAGLLRFYEENNGASEEQIRRAAEIEAVGRRDPSLAVRKLQLSLREKPDMEWHGSTFSGLDDLLDFLEKNADRLDELTEEFYHSRTARAWLDYIGQGSMISEIEKAMLTR